MFTKRYDIKNKGDAIVVSECKIGGTILLFDILFSIFELIFLYIIISDWDETCFYVAIFILLVWRMLHIVERRYIIRPDSIIIKHGIIRKRIPLDKVDFCFYSSRSYMTLVDDKGKETTIDLIHLPDEVDDAVTATLKNCNIKIRRVGAFEKDKEPGKHNYHFKMYQKGRVGAYITFIVLTLLLDVPFGIWIFQEESMRLRLFLLACILAYTALWVFLALKMTQTIYVDGENIEIRSSFKKPVKLNVKDISWVHNELKHHSTNTGGYDVEELEIHVGDEILSLSGNISRAYKSYDLFLAYLQDYDVPFSLEEGKLLTYETVEENSEKEIHEILNKEEHAFTCNDDYVIENGLFEGRILDKELAVDGEYDAYIKKHLRLARIIRALYFISSITLIITMIACRADAIGFIPALAIPGTIFVGMLLVSSLDDLISFKDITRNATCYKATIFMADLLSKEQTVMYAYDSGDKIRVIEPLEINKKMSQADYEALYNVPTYIWANPAAVPNCVEGSEEKPFGKSKYVRKVFLYLLLEVVLILGSIGLNNLVKGRQGLNLTENDNYEAVLYDYEDSFDENDPSGSSKVFPQDYTEIYTDTYKWAADATALYAYLEYGDAKYIGGHPRTYDSKTEEKLFLEKAWKITDRESAKKKIDDVITYGHQSKCRAYTESSDEVEQLISAIKADYGDSFSFEDSMEIDEAYFEKNDISIEYFYAVKGAACANVRFGENGLAAYDYERLLRVINMFNDCGYLSDDEYMGLVHNLDVALQKQYKSFADIHECYLYGEMFRLAQVDDNSNQTIEDIETALKTMGSERLYSSIERDYNTELSVDWKDLLVSE
ncbi:Protein of unknown function [Pseudobutyrivibrio sp. YE44]|uniref:DUF1266 domain-containing protein n=1 Tax=Pseudobutyrivibrio sp. YE44 TaxID=1520802 RepID=UPI00087FC344|nr:DUF1266 domain-containing protein [Pseudobutyrivibrio sp. YE44]SDB35405.1 Protein of unknown function [Pseudobutyrivibrio sp. YE44]